MSARVVSVGSQPAIEIDCDWDEDRGCYVTLREFVDTKREARDIARRQGWIIDTYYGASHADYCPSHAPRVLALIPGPAGRKCGSSSNG